MEELLISLLREQPSLHVGAQRKTENIYQTNKLYHNTWQKCLCRFVRLLIPCFRQEFPWRLCCLLLFRSHVLPALLVRRLVKLSCRSFREWISRKTRSEISEKSKCKFLFPTSTMRYVISVRKHSQAWVSRHVHVGRFACSRFIAIVIVSLFSVVSFPKPRELTRYGSKLSVARRF